MKTFSHLIHKPFHWPLGFAHKSHSCFTGELLFPTFAEVLRAHNSQITLTGLCLSILDLFLIYSNKCFEAVIKQWTLHSYFLLDKVVTAIISHFSAQLEKGYTSVFQTPTDQVFISSGVLFNNINGLITHYRHHPVRGGHNLNHQLTLHEWESTNNVWFWLVWNCSWFC